MHLRLLQNLSKFLSQNRFEKSSGLFLLSQKLKNFVIIKNMCWLIQTYFGCLWIFRCIVTPKDCLSQKKNFQSRELFKSNDCKPIELLYTAFSMPFCIEMLKSWLVISILYLKHNLLKGVKIYNFPHYIQPNLKNIANLKISQKIVLNIENRLKFFPDIVSCKLIIRWQLK